MMRHWIVHFFLLFLLVGIADAAEVPTFRRQMIQVPSSSPEWGIWPYWKDINKDGLTDLLVLDQKDSRAFIYNQNSSGFPAEPTQCIEFPGGTAWFTLLDVDKHPGDEMLISTSERLVYYRQDNGIFEIKPEKLIEAKQAIPVNHPPIAIEPDKWAGDLKNAIPVVFSDHTVLYKCDENYQLKQVEEIEYQYKKSIHKETWSIWSLGAKRTEQVVIRTTAQGKSEEAEEKEPTKESEYVEKEIEKIKKKSRWWGDYAIEREDINADNRKDLILWKTSGELFDLKTNVMVFIRQEDGNLPQRPNQILRCKGVPFDMDYRKWHASILSDINDDGLLDIVLLDLKTKPLSVSTFIETVVSKGLDFVISVRPFKKDKGYSEHADFMLDVTAMLPIFGGVADFITLDGDFNADGRKDLIVRRTLSQCDIYLSSSASGFFDLKPKLQLQVPQQGRMFVEDLNNDGISDIYLIDYEKGQITFFVSGSS
jgi:hypothetical protein